MNIDCYVINVVSNMERRQAISEMLSVSGIQFKIVPAVTPETVTELNLGNMNPTAVAVWQSHRNCIKESSENDAYTLILEDDAVIDFDNAFLTETIRIMHKNEIDFLQIGYLGINVVQSSSILIRNIYNFFVRKGLFAQLFLRFGLAEVKRAKEKTWLKPIPRNYILNDIRFGAHCYVVSPSFSAQMLNFNNPPFLATDDFYVSLSKMK